MIVRNILFFIGIAALAQCQTLSKNESNEKLNPGFAYAVNQPAETFEMQLSLQEISGLSLSEDDNLLTLNDEQGKIFKINRKTGALISEVLFHEDGGDFEGIEMVESTVFALKSKGKLYAIYDYLQAGKVHTERFTSPELDKVADVEGLGYDPVKKILLLACKGPGAQALEREVWSFDPQTKKFSDQPVLKISYQQVHNWLAEHHADWEVFKDFAADQATEFHFGCSGFAVHPQTGYYYLLSSPGKILLVCKSDGSIMNILRLDKKVHAQPEGIVFAQDGTMYISNEGKKESSPKIYRIPENKK